jgi:hypothetical protein
MYVLMYTSQLDVIIILSAHCFSKVAEISVFTLAPVSPIFNITGSNMDVSTPLASEYLGSVQHNTNSAGETFTLSSSSQKI